MNNKLIVSGVLVLVILVGGYFILNTNTKDTMMKKNNEVMMTEEQNSANDNNQPLMLDGYQGKVLSGTVTPYLDFTIDDYEQALEENKVIFLNFYANWCPICRNEEPHVFEAFNNLNNENVVGFRVNYNDTQTDSDEKALAQQFQIPYQHTKVILVNGQQVLKETAEWDSATTIEQINNFAN